MKPRGRAMKKLPDESRIVKKSDLKKLEKNIMKKDRKEDDKRYQRKKPRK